MDVLNAKQKNLLIAWEKISFILNVPNLRMVRKNRRIGWIISSIVPQIWTTKFIKTLHVQVVKGVQISVQKEMHQMSYVQQKELKTDNTLKQDVDPNNQSEALATKFKVESPEKSIQKKQKVG